MRHSPLIRTSVVGLALACFVGAVVFAAERPVTTRPAATQSGAARHPFAVDDPVPETRQQAEVRKLFDFLLSEYARLLEKSKDRVSRSLIVVCMSRIGRDDATDKILSLLETEKDNLVRLTAWQAMLSRASMVNPQQHKRWVAATARLIKADAFRGELKRPAAHLLATGVPDRATKEAWRLLFSKTDSRDERDVDAIEALGHALANWRSADLMEWVLSRLLEPADAVRADRVLRAAGSSAPSTGDLAGAELRQAARQAAAEHRKWWNGQKASWEETRTVTDGSWRGLRPQFLPPPQAIGEVNPRDKDWRNDLELQAPNLRAFDVGLVVDATGSMTPVLEWLQRDVAKLLQGFGAVAIEPRIGLTFYRDKNDQFVAMTKPLTGRVPDLLKVLSQMRAGGGGDIPEAVLDGLEDCFKKNPWTRQASARKIVILIGDAPPHRETIGECIGLARNAKENGFRVYAVKCSLGTEELESFDQIAAAGGGAALSVTMLELVGAMTGDTFERLAAATRMAATRAAATAPGEVAADRPVDLSTMIEPKHLATAPSTLPATTTASTMPATTGAGAFGASLPQPDTRPAGHRLLARVLVDVINPQFKDRIDPMVGVLWEMLEPVSRETANDPPPGGVRGLDRLGL
jgi:hypothetical protein